MADPRSLEVACARARPKHVDAALPVLCLKLLCLKQSFAQATFGELAVPSPPPPLSSSAESLVGFLLTTARTALANPPSPFSAEKVSLVSFC